MTNALRASGKYLALHLTLLAAATASAATWRTATGQELAAALPARAPVLAERIETEMRSASGVTDERGHLIAGVVLITAGYSANGKYSDYLLVQAPIRIHDTLIPPGNYLLGWTRATGDDLLVTLYEAATGKVLVEVSARHNQALHRVEQLRVWPVPHGIIQLGRFSFEYSIAAP